MNSRYQQETRQMLMELEADLSARQQMHALLKARRAKEEIANEKRAKGMELLPVKGHPTRRAWQYPPGRKATATTPPEHAMDYDSLLATLTDAMEKNPAFARRVVDAAKQVAAARPKKQPREEPADPEHDALVETWAKRLKDSMGDEAAYHQIRRELADLPTRTLKALQRRAGRKRWSSRKDAIKFLVNPHEMLVGARARDAHRDGRTAA